VKRWVVALALAIPGAAAAQVPVYPGNSTPQAPLNLDPGASGSQAPPPAPPPTTTPSQPGVVVVKPDGSVTYPGANTEAPTGYYIDSGTPGSYDQPVEVHAGPVPELHVVRSGDTLWDICFYYFNDPWQWPKVWSFNPQITNPHWIYPGDLVRLLPRGMFATEPQSAEPEKGNDVGEKPIDNIPPPARRVQLGLKQTAFVEKADLDQSITIDGSVDEKTLLGTNDSVYLTYPSNKPPRVGQRYSVYVPGNAVKSNGKEVGSYVHLLGTVEVVSVKQDKRARGVIVEANQEIERGAKVGPLVKEFKTVPPVAPKVDAQGTIVAMLSHDQLIGQGEVVFIDLGKSSGLEVGNRMFVVRRGDALPTKARDLAGQDDQRFPARQLGQVIVVDVGDKISIALVTVSVQEMGVGDTVLMQAVGK
jgi:LysM domain